MVGAIVVLVLVGLGSCATLIDTVVDDVSAPSSKTVQESSSATATASGSSSTATKSSGIDFPGKQENDTGVRAGASVTSDRITTTAAPLRSESGFGGQYLCSLVTIRNNSGKNARFASYDWKLQAPSGTTRDTSFFGSENDLSSGEVAPGGTAQGDVCFEQQEAPAAGTYVMLFDPTFRFSSDRVGWVNVR